jgi:hypothetical protein
MEEDQGPCGCGVCLADEPELYVAPLAQIEAVRARRVRQDPYGDICPRCGNALGRIESVVDTVGYAHFVRPCAACLALWVVS